MMTAQIQFYVHDTKQTVGFTLDRDSEIQAMHEYIDVLIQNECPFKLYVTTE